MGAEIEREQRQRVINIEAGEQRGSEGWGIGGGIGGEEGTE